MDTSAAQIHARIERIENVAPNRVRITPLEIGYYTYVTFADGTNQITHRDPIDVNVGDRIRFGRGPLDLFEIEIENDNDGDGDGNGNTTKNAPNHRPAKRWQRRSESMTPSSQVPGRIITRRQTQQVCLQ